MAGIYKAYDIRGLYGKEIDEETARRIARAFVAVVGARPGERLVVGRDMRESAESITRAVLEGITSMGVHVDDVGLTSTPMLYFAIGSSECRGGLNVTASHNPAEYIGFKLCREGPVALSGDSGIGEVEDLARRGEPSPGALRGEVSRREILGDYVQELMRFAEGIGPLRVVVDAGNGMAGRSVPKLLERIPVAAIPLYFELDGTFPNHEANPLKEENLADLRKAVREAGADLGVAFDGDADRCALVDETGAIVPNDLTTALLAQELLAHEPGGGVVYDLRSSRVVEEEIRARGGRPIRERVGHSFLKATLRRERAVFGGELSGHYYFRDFFHSDCPEIAMLTVFRILSRERRPLSSIVAPLRRLHASGELNFRVEDKEGMLARLERAFEGARTDRLDGVTVAFEDWWFNARPSNTEPYLRLNIEAETAERLEDARRRLLAILGDPV